MTRSISQQTTHYYSLIFCFILSSFNVSTSVSNSFIFLLAASCTKIEKKTLCNDYIMHLPAEAHPHKTTQSCLNDGWDSGGYLNHTEGIETLSLPRYHF